MIKNKNAESIAWIVIWILLISVISLGLYNLIVFSDNINSSFENESTMTLIEYNALNIIYKLDTEALNEWEIFYIDKDDTQKTIKIYTWSTNEKYKFVDRYWNNTYSSWAFERIWKVEGVDEETSVKKFSINVKKL